MTADHDLHAFITRVEWEPENDRPDMQAAFDEMVTGPVDMVHIERMDEGVYWMAIYKGDERQVVTFHTARGAKVYARTEKE
jgi:hypothetical protein